MEEVWHRSMPLKVIFSPWSLSRSVSCHKVSRHCHRVQLSQCFASPWIQNQWSQRPWTKTSNTVNQSQPQPLPEFTGNSCWLTPSPPNTLNQSLSMTNVLQGTLFWGPLYLHDRGGREQPKCEKSCPYKQLEGRPYPTAAICLLCETEVFTMGERSWEPSHGKIISGKQAQWAAPADSPSPVSICRML